MKLWKITTIDGKTRPGETNECQWGPGVTHTASGKGELCGPGFIHAYDTSPEVAMLLNPIHANYSPFLLWECEGEVVKRDGLLKVGTTSLTTIRRVEVPLPTPCQLVRAAVLLAKQVTPDPAWNNWADSWLSGVDRSAAAASAAARARARRAAAKAAARAAWAAWESAAAAARSAAGAAGELELADVKAAAASRAARAASAAAWESAAGLDIVGITARAFAEEQL